MQKSLSKSSLGTSQNKLFLKLMSRKYRHVVEQCENQSPLPIRSSSQYKSTFNFSPPVMPLSQHSTNSLTRLPRTGHNLLPALAMLPREHSSGLI